MAFASSSMVETLTKDLAPLLKKITKLQDHIKEYEGSELGPKVAELFKNVPEMGKVIVGYDLDVKGKNPDKKKPGPTFPEEGAYKKIRKLLTDKISVADTLEKKALAEKKVFDAAVTIKVVGAARGEILGKDKDLAQALAAVARGDKGRSSPKTDDLPALNHIHIGGHANDNLVFDPAKKLILGRVPFHMDSTMNAAKKEKVKKVCGRSGGVFTAQILNKEEISEV